MFQPIWFLFEWLEKKPIVLECALFSSKSSLSHSLYHFSIASPLISVPFLPILSPIFSHLPDFPRRRRSATLVSPATKQEPKCKIAQGLCDDLRRRISHYLSDYVDGIVGHQTLHKTISTIFFLYFACLLPTIAFGKRSLLGCRHAVACHLQVAINSSLFFSSSPKRCAQ